MSSGRIDSTPTNADPVVGSQLGRYEIIARLARGGMATVYVGRIQAIGGFERLVAVKMLRPSFAQDDNVRAMFLDEARLAARIRHPNAVPVIDVHEDADLGTYLVMDYIEGCDLSALLSAAERNAEVLEPRIVIRLVIDALSGLHAAHTLEDADGNRLNLVHRDVSPHNVLIGVDGVARIADFGIAKAETRMASTTCGEIKGKLAYMAPERVYGTESDHRSDIFSAGVVLWEALTGKRLFDEGSDVDTASQVLVARIDAPSSIRAELSPLDNVVLKALAREPSERFDTAADFVDALESAASTNNAATAKEVAHVVTRLMGETIARNRESMFGAEPSSDPPAEAMSLRNSSTQNRLKTAFPGTQVRASPASDDSSSYPRGISGAPPQRRRKRLLRMSLAAIALAALAASAAALWSSSPQHPTGDLPNVDAAILEAKRQDNSSVNATGSHTSAQSASPAPIPIDVQAPRSTEMQIPSQPAPSSLNGTGLKGADPKEANFQNADLEDADVDPATLSASEEAVRVDRRARAERARARRAERRRARKAPRKIKNAPLENPYSSF